MQTIADQLGVSKYAVSRSLSGKDGVSETTRQTVEQLANALGYVPPSVVASARTIQLVLHDHDPVNSEVQLRIQRGIQRAAEIFGLLRPGGERIEMSGQRRPGIPGGAGARRID